MTKGLWLEFRVAGQLELEDKRQAAELGWAPAHRAYPREGSPMSGFQDSWGPTWSSPSGPHPCCCLTKPSLTQLVSEHKARGPQGPRYSQQVLQTLQGVRGVS